MKRAAWLGAILLAAAVAGCSSVTPVPIRSGDVCEYCKQPILDVKIAAEIAAPAGKLPLKFKTVTCMAKYLHEHGSVPGELYVTDYNTGRLVMARSAVFVKGIIDENTKTGGYFAFGDVKSAVAFAKKTGGATADWAGVVKQVEAGAV
jgi:nitrous oxide reductase accessory protein NosL